MYFLVLFLWKNFSSYTIYIFISNTLFEIEFVKGVKDLLAKNRNFLNNNNNCCRYNNY